MTRRYKTSYRSTRDVKRFHVSFDAPVSDTEEERLQARIFKEADFIARCPNYPQLCQEARTRMNYYIKRLHEMNDPLAQETGLSVECVLIEGDQFHDWYAKATEGSPANRTELVRAHLEEIRQHPSDTLQAYFKEHWDDIPEVPY